jgi:hypothetical protein
MTIDTMDVYLSTSKVLLVGMRVSVEGDFPLEEGMESEGGKYRVLESEEEAQRQLWSQDFPQEFIEQTTHYGGIEEFVKSVKDNLK